MEENEQHLRELSPIPRGTQMSSEQRQWCFTNITKLRLEGLMHSEIQKVLEAKLGFPLERSRYYRLRRGAARVLMEELKEDRDELKARFMAEKRNLFKDARSMLRENKSPAAIQAANAVQDSTIKFWQSLGLLPKDDVTKVQVSGAVDISQVLKEIDEDEKKDADRKRSVDEESK